MYDRNKKKFRQFTIEYGPEGIGIYHVQARSSLEAGARFIQEKPGEVMWDIKE